MEMNIQMYTLDFNKESDYIKLSNGDYVDGSFRLSTDDVEEMETIIDW